MGATIDELVKRGLWVQFLKIKRGGVRCIIMKPTAPRGSAKGKGDDASSALAHAVVQLNAWGTF